jgi:DnaJ-class molecular chaperone
MPWVWIPDSENKKETPKEVPKEVVVECPECHGRGKKQERVEYVKKDYGYGDVEYGSCYKDKECADCNGIGKIIKMLVVK